MSQKINTIIIWIIFLPIALIIGIMVYNKHIKIKIRKLKPEQVYKKLTQKIVLAGLEYRKEIKYEVDNRLSSNAGAEIIYFLIHWVDRISFQIFGNQKRNEIYDVIYKRVISEYSKSILTPETPQSLLENLALQMLKTLNKRQIIYSQCICCLWQEARFPSIGTMEFALSFYIHKALGKTTRDNVDNILKGKNKLTKNDLTDFPCPEDQLTDCIFIHNILAKSKMSALIKEL